MDPSCWWAYQQWPDHPQLQQTPLGFKMGNLQVRIFHTVPVAGMGSNQPTNQTV